MWRLAWGLGLVGIIILGLGPDAIAAEKSKQLPFLGPGTDTLSPVEYLRTYRKYIRESILLGFPPDKCASGSCDQSLAMLFRMAGLFTYPIPSGADVKKWKSKQGNLECYSSGGVLAQIERNPTGKALKAASIVYSKSPQAVKKLWRSCRRTPLRLQKDKDTGLERLAGLPVGYPHPLLCSGSQGLIVRRISFSGTKLSCAPSEYKDNSWTAGHRLDQNRCQSTQSDLKLAWAGKISARQFAKKERVRQRASARAVAVAGGANGKKADQIVDRYFRGLLDHELTYVGMAMRSLEMCNRLGMNLTPSRKTRTGDGGGGRGGKGGTGGTSAE